jgi:hypothetical protein
MDRWRGSGVCCVALYCLRDNEDKKAEGKVEKSRERGKKVGRFPREPHTISAADTASSFPRVVGKFPPHSSGTAAATAAGETAAAAFA